MLAETPEHGGSRLPTRSSPHVHRASFRLWCEASSTRLPAAAFLVAADLILFAGDRLLSGLDRAPAVYGPVPW